MGTLSKIKWWVAAGATVLIAVGLVLSLIAKPGSPIFRLKKVREGLVSKFAALSVTRKANYDIGLAETRINEFNQLKTEADRLNPSELTSLAETQGALKRVESDLKTVRIRYHAINSKIQPDKIDALLGKFSELLNRQFETIQGLQKRISDSEQLKKLSVYKNELTGWKTAAEDQKADLADDKRLNESLAPPKIEANGQIKAEDNTFKLVINSTTFPVKSTQYNLKDYQDTLVEIEGTLNPKGVLTINTLTAQTTTLLAGTLKITASGTLEQKKGTFVLAKKEQPDFIVESGRVNLTQYIDKFVEVRGELEKNKITISHIKLI